MMHNLRFLHTVCLALGCLCLFAPLSGASSPPKLYFKKDLLESNNERYAYHIEKGDYVYDILRRFKIPSEKRPQILERTKELNPHIEDLNRIEPGQIVYFPDSVKQHSDFTVPEIPSFESPVPTTTYTVKSGEHLGQILRQNVGLSDKLIFDEYLELFRKLNPDIENPDLLEVGQRITVPLPPERERKNLALTSRKKVTQSPGQKEKTQARKKGRSVENASTTPGPPQAAPASVQDTVGETEADAESDRGAAPGSQPEPEPEPKPKPEGDKKEKRLALDMLREMGFSPSAEEKILYPSREGGWIHVDLDRTPILETPWGQSLLLVPEQYATPLVRKKVERTDLRSCRVKDSWEPSDLFQSLQKATESRVIFWNPGESLILNFRQLVLEMRALYQFVIKTGGESRYHLFFRAPLAQEHAAAMLAGFLKQKDIHLHTIADSDGDKKLSRIEPVSQNTIKQPAFTHANLWPRVADKLASDGERPDPPANHSPSTLLNYLRERDLAHKENIRLEFLTRENTSTSVSLSLRATKLDLQPPSVLLQGDMAEPYLFGLLDLEGYAGYGL
ncbi:MAG: LysM domain-containing protein [Desulfohalobiaceae bacterium]